MSRIHPDHPPSRPSGHTLPRIAVTSILSRILTPVLGIILCLALTLPAQAECYVDYKAKRDNPLRLAYGVSQVSDGACGKPGMAQNELAPRLASDGWTLLKILSSFGPEGLQERKSSAGAFFLRY